jgi:hypothetical protein
VAAVGHDREACRRDVLLNQARASPAR